MLKKYFQIIRKALSENRLKGSVYYEAHHIVPKSFNKKSGTVLLTPQEHYGCHRILAQELGKHSTYGQKMLWAFHRLAYDKRRKLTADEYAEARLILMPLWKRKFTEEHKQKITKDYLIKYYNMSPDDSIKYIKTKRPIAFFGGANFANMIEKFYENERK